MVSATQSPPIYYGWFVLAAAALMEMLATGATSYAAGLFVLPLEQELGLSRAAANSSIPILFLGAAIFVPGIGYLLDRTSIRWLMVAGGVLFAVTFALIASTSTIWIMGLALFIAGAIAFVAMNTLPTATLVSRWFYRRRH